jgi:hypothetical protein
MTPATPTPAPAGPSGAITGGATPGAALTSFMDAVKAEDLQAMSAVWGTTTGPARETIPRTELEKREVYTAKCLRHDAFRVLNETKGSSGARVLAVELTKGPLTKTTNFTLVPGPQNRWYVFDIDLAPVNAICLAR